MRETSLDETRVGQIFAAAAAPAAVLVARVGRREGHQRLREATQLTFKTFR